MRAWGTKAAKRSAATHGTSGVTLMEVLVATVVLLAVFALVAVPLALGFSYLEKTTARVDAQRAARAATEAITRELAEAMYVFDIPPAGTLLAFSVPQGRATTPAPGDVVRYWRALRDPGQAHRPYYTEIAPGHFADPDSLNPYFVARTQVDDPWKTDDDWNDSDATWGVGRATYFYPDGREYPSGTTWPESQPGYPWLEAVRLYPGGGENRTTYYRENAVAITPTDANYDVPELRFAAARVSDETLAPSTATYPRNYAVYAARYPMWSGFAAPYWDEGASAWRWREVGSIRIYRNDVLIYQTKVDTDDTVFAGDGGVWVCAPGEEPGDAGAYDTRLYPRERSPAAQPYAFGIDYDAGTVNFAFPAADLITADGSLSYPLPTAASAADGVVVPESHRVTVDGELYRRVEGFAAAGGNEYSIDGTTLSFNPNSPPAPGSVIRAYYHYRNNQDADVVIASYSSKRLVDVTATVSKQDRAARRPRDARQEFRLSTRVEVRNVPE